MSLGIYPVFEPKLTGTTFDALGEVLAANYQSLDNIAESARLTLITAFADNRPIPDGFDGHPEELAEVMGDWDEWFDPAEGRAAMQALADHIKTSPHAAAQLDDPTDVTQELEEMARVLAAASAQGIRFRLAMS
jgi:hypothetical protein